VALRHSNLEQRLFAVPMALKGGTTRLPNDEPARGDAASVVYMIAATRWARVAVAAFRPVRRPSRRRMSDVPFRDYGVAVSDCDGGRG
jgi:hypothetical protein